VLLIDLDPSQLTQSLGLTNQERTIYGALKGDYIRACNDIERIRYRSSTLDLSGAEIELSSEPGRIYFKELIDEIAKLTISSALIVRPS
jgi:chromosome partitioning protein